MSSRFASARAFTLLELLVVVAIIGILASMLLAGLSRSMAVAKAMKCTSNLRQILLAQAQYVGDFNAYPPAKTMWWTVFESYGVGGVRDTQRNLVLFSAPGLHCPTAKYDFVTSNNASYASDYGYNSHGLEFDVISYGLGASDGVVMDASHLPTITPVRESSVVAPANMLAFADNFRRQSKVQKTLDVGTGLSGEGNSTSGFTMRSANGEELAGRRHRGRLSSGFCDGHVESLKLNTLFFDNSEAARSRWHRDNLPHMERALRR